MPLGLKFVHVRRQMVVRKVKPVNRVFVVHKNAKRLWVVCKVRTRQHGARQLLVVKRASPVQNLYCDFYGNRRKPKPAKKVAVVRARRAQVYKVFRKLPRREWTA